MAAGEAALAVKAGRDKNAHLEKGGRPRPVTTGRKPPHLAALPLRMTVRPMVIAARGGAAGARTSFRLFWSVLSDRPTHATCAPPSEFLGAISEQTRDQRPARILLPDGGSVPQ